MDPMQLLFLFPRKKAFSEGNIHHYIVYRDQQVLHSLWCYHALSSSNQLIYTTTAFLLLIERKDLMQPKTLTHSLPNGGSLCYRSEPDEYKSILMETFPAAGEHHSV